MTEDTGIASVVARREMGSAADPVSPAPFPRGVSRNETTVGSASASSFLAELVPRYFLAICMVSSIERVGMPVAGPLYLAVIVKLCSLLSTD
jgi:hypothetical protein